MRNDKTGEWSKDSTFGDLETVANNIRAMDPLWQASLKADVQARSAHRAAPENGGFPGQALFLRACAACHTIGHGDKVGPDLKGLTTRRSRDWLNAFIAAPEAMRAKGDPAALALTEKFKGVAMPNLALAETDIADVLSYVEAQSHAATLAAQDGAGAHQHGAQQDSAAQHANPQQGSHDPGAHKHH
jgi:cytochrome c2